MPRKYEFASMMITDSPGKTISRGSLILPLSSTLATAIFAPNVRIFPDYHIFPRIGEFAHGPRDGFEPVWGRTLDGLSHQFCLYYQITAW